LEKVTARVFAVMLYITHWCRSWQSQEWASIKGTIVTAEHCEEFWDLLELK